MRHSEALLTEQLILTSLSSITATQKIKSHPQWFSKLNGNFTQI